MTKHCGVSCFLKSKAQDSAPAHTPEIFVQSLTHSKLFVIEHWKACTKQEDTRHNVKRRFCFILITVKS